MTRTKAEWRRVLVATRRAIEPDARVALSEAIVARVAALASFDLARTLFGYEAMGAEANPRTLLSRSGASRVLVPAIGSRDDEPGWCDWRGASSGDVCQAVGSDRFPAVILVPGVGFDHAGMRLGRGQGFYDRALTALRQSGEVCVVGLAFDCQVVSHLPSEPWDQAMDYIVSESRVIQASPSIGRNVAGSR